MKDSMYYFSTLQHRYKTIIIYNFYQSYHGHNSCDAAASHAKKRINTQQRDNNIPFLTATDLVASINTLKNSHAQLASRMRRTKIKVSKIDGIKSYFMYKFPKEGTVAAYSDSTSENPTKTYKMKVKSFPELTGKRIQ